MGIFEKKVNNYIRQHQLIEAGDRLLVACSGGADSVALLCYLRQQQTKLGFEMAAIHVNHMLRGKESAEDRLFVERLCEAQNITVFATDISIPSILEAEKGNLQAICRRERYSYFEEVLVQKGYTKLVLAHHADDQIETVLMALVRGSNNKGVVGMPRIRPFGEGQLIRPLLSVTKEEITEYLREQSQAYREDASNSKDLYTRNRFRHHIIPLMEKENPRIAEAVQNFSERLQEDEEALEQYAEEVFREVVTAHQDDTYTIRLNSFQKKPLALQRRVILLLLNYIYEDPNILQSHALWSAIREQATQTEGNAILHLPKGAVVIRQYDQILFSKKPLTVNEVNRGQLAFSKWYSLMGSLRIYIGTLSDDLPLDVSSSAQIYYFQSVKTALPLRIRARQNGDRIHLQGMDSSKKVSRLFIDEKIPLNNRDEWPLIVSNDDEVIAVPGIRVSHHFSSEPKEEDDLFFIIDQII